MKSLRRVAARPVTAAVTTLTAAAALALTSCGVPPTGVIQAGAPATAQSPSITLYFLMGGRLIDVTRQVATADVASAVSALFDGPTPAESAKGLFTALPALAGDPVVHETASTVTIRLPEGIDPLPALPLQQLVCTVTSARRAALPALRTARPVPTSTPGTDPTTPQLRPGLDVTVTGASWHALLSAADCPSF